MHVCTCVCNHTETLSSGYHAVRLCVSSSKVLVRTPQPLTCQLLYNALRLASLFSVLIGRKETAWKMDFKVALNYWVLVIGVSLASISRRNLAWRMCGYTVWMKGNVPVNDVVFLGCNALCTQRFWETCCLHLLQPWRCRRYVSSETLAYLQDHTASAPPVLLRP